MQHCPENGPRFGRIRARRLAGLGARPRAAAQTLGVAWLCLAVLPAAAPCLAADPPPEVLSAFLQDPLDFFLEQRIADAVACGQVVLQDDSHPPEARRDVLTTLGAVYLATGRRPQARAAFLEMIEADPTGDLALADRLPPPVVRTYYALRDSLLLSPASPTAEADPTLEVRTIAIGTIENNAVVQGEYDLGHFARGLEQILITDLMAATPMKIVDRQRLDVLLDEIGMSSNEQIVDPRFAVPFGRLCGAQSFLFGSLFQVDPKKLRLDLRWVDTSTSEVLLSEGVEMKIGSADDLFKLERKVLLDMIAPRMRELLVRGGESPTKDEFEKRLERHLDERKRARSSLAGGASYVDVLLATGEAVLAEDRGDYAEARAAWARVQQLDPDDPLADTRGAALVAYLDASGGSQ